MNHTGNFTFGLAELDLRTILAPYISHFIFTIPPMVCVMPRTVGSHSLTADCIFHLYILIHCFVLPDAVFSCLIDLRICTVFIPPLALIFGHQNGAMTMSILMVPDAVT